jgi:hypothetical protein
MQSLFDGGLWWAKVVWSEVMQPGGGGGRPGAAVRTGERWSETLESPRTSS